MASRDILDMKSLHLAIIIGSGMIAAATFTILIPYAMQESTNQNATDEQKARQLAENSLPDLKTVSGYHFEGILYARVQSFGGPGPSELMSVQVSYQTPSGGILTFIEDPKMTKVLNVTVFEPLRTMPPP